MQTTINGLKIFLSGEATSPPIVFVHGFPYDHTMWEKQIKQLNTKYYCITYDIRGFGESVVGDGQYTMESYVEDLFTIIKELKLDKPTLCGLSMGGYICLRAVELSEHRFKSLILLDTKAESDSDEGKLIRAEKIKQINEEGIEAFIDSFVPACFAQQTILGQRKLFDDVLEKCKRNNPTGTKGGLIAMLSRTDTSNYLNKIKISSLIIVGEFDELTPPNTMKGLFEKIENCEYIEIPNVGHMTAIEAPEEVNRAIQDFLET